MWCGAPKGSERRQITQSRHHVDAQLPRLRSLAAEVNGVPTRQQSRIKSRDRYSARLKGLERFKQAAEVLRLRKQEKIDVLANLRRAVKHAGLPAHEQSPGAMFLDRRKTCRIGVGIKAASHG
jgi:hypothetical protein